MMSDTKLCPFCAEEIKAAAVKCRYCGEWMPGHSRKTAIVESVGDDYISTGDMNNVKGAAFGRGAMAANVEGNESSVYQAQGDINIGKKLRDEQYEIALNWEAFGKPRMRHFDLSNQKLTKISLAGADLRYTDFQGTDLRIVNLCGADLHKADLRGARLIDADLRGADLGEAKLQETNLLGTKYDSKTIWPDGFDPEEAGAEIYN